ncbi:MAG: hypothetical protein ACR2G1_07750, partial [Rubrobacteraceae bacterium]
MRASISNPLREQSRRTDCQHHHEEQETHKLPKFRLDVSRAESLREREGEAANDRPRHTPH